MSRYLQHPNLIDDLAAQCERALRVLDGVKTLTPAAHSEYYTALAQLRRVTERVDERRQKSALRRQLRASIASLQEQKRCSEIGGATILPFTGGAR